MTDLQHHELLLSDGEARVPRLSTGAALRRHWVRALLPLVLFAGLAVAAGLARTPQYTAEARLAVGRVDASTPGALAGFTSTSQALAETYSRTLTADAVVADASERLGVEPGEVRRNISAAPIPETPVFRVRGVESSEEGAVALANTAAAALVRTILEDQRSSPDSPGLLRDYGVAARRLATARVEARRIAENLGERISAFERRELSRAEAAVASADLEARSLSQTYQNSLQSAGSSGVLEVIQQARTASSDRGSVLQLLIFIGVVAGGSIGLALALLAGNRELRRRAGFG